MLTLIGGIQHEGALRRDVTLRPLSGSVEMALSEIGASVMSQPEKITAFLAETVATVGGKPCDRVAAAALSVGDRQHLVRQIGAAMGSDRVWLSGNCHACGEEFDVAVDQSALPVKEASNDYPSAEVDLGARYVSIRSPTGEDQAAIARAPEKDARDLLLRRLAGLKVDAPLSPSEEACIEAAVEAMSPEVTLEVATTCPSCAASLQVTVDPYLGLALGSGDILSDVHVLASRYHWSEASILDLPKARRKAYLAMIDRARGISGAGDPPEMAQ